MKRIFFLMVLVLSKSSFAQNHLPAKFDITENYFAFGTDLTLSCGGKVEERILSLTATFEYIDSKGSIIARGQKEKFSWTRTIDVYDKNHQLIGYIEEEIFDSMFRRGSIYSIKDQFGNVIAKSWMLDFFSTTIDLYDLSNKVIVSIYRPAFNITDRWQIIIAPSNKIDTRIIPLIPAFKTYSDNQKKKRGRRQ